MPLWAGIVLVVIGLGCLFARGFWPGLGFVAIAFGVLVCFHPPAPAPEGNKNPDISVTPQKAKDTANSGSSSALSLDTMSPRERKAIVYLGDQLEKHPAMQAYVLRAAPAEPGGGNEMEVVQNSASRKIYQNVDSPEVTAQMLSHKPGDVFEITIAAAPGPLTELTGAGVEAFNASLVRNGIQEGYRDDVLYLLNGDFEIRGRDAIIATARNLRATLTKAPETN